jgi:recombinational DNA repair protein (RecF pathway)
MTQCADCGRLICCDDIYCYRGKDYCEACVNTIKNLDTGGRFYGEKIIKDEAKGKS